jgi:hypothetical protein
VSEPRRQRRIPLPIKPQAILSIHRPGNILPNVSAYPLVRYNSRNRCSGEGMKSLVVYYSLTGKTRLVAQVIAEALNATLQISIRRRTNKVV